VSDGLGHGCPTIPDEAGGIKFCSGEAPVVSVIVVGQMWRGGLANCGDRCPPGVAERGVREGSISRCLCVILRSLRFLWGDCGLRISDFGFVGEEVGGRPGAVGNALLSLIWLSKGVRGSDVGARGS
jgi:hypothetical protein